MYTNPRMHRLVPAVLAVPLVGLVEPRLRRLRNPAEAADALRLMTDLLQFTPRAAEAGAVTRQHLRERSILRELFWRPWLLRRSRVIDGHHWEAARAGGRGSVMVIAHVGGSWAVPAILVRAGYNDLHVVASAHLWGNDEPGLVAATHRFIMEEYASLLGRDRMSPNTVNPDRLRELVDAGATVCIAFDVPGSAGTPFLGRSVALTSGPASLAFHSGSKVLPVITERRGARLDLRMLTPIDPRDYRDLPGLRAAIARAYEPIVTGRPESVENAWFPSPLVTEALSPQTPPPAPHV